MDEQVEVLLKRLVDERKTDDLKSLVEAKEASLHYRYMEAVSSLFDMTDRWVDPRGDRDEFSPLSGSYMSYDQERVSGFRDEQQLEEARNLCRYLSQENEFCINGHENRINYTYGTGFEILASKKDGSVSDSAVENVQAAIDRWQEVNDWYTRQQEQMKRWDRDGESILRKFFVADTPMLVRFVEPDLLTSKNNDRTDDGLPIKWGIVTDPDDVETPVAYMIDGEEVPAAEIQHRKANVDLNVMRGMQTFWPTRTNLDRADKILRNMAVLVTIQSSIALIRNYENASPSTMPDIVNRKVVNQFTDPVSGQNRKQEIFRPGSIISAPQGTRYEFPAVEVDAAGFSGVLQAILRAVASRLVMPEFMLTSDASNGNYASTLVAEGPAVKTFERIQKFHARKDKSLVMDALQFEVEQGRLSQSDLDSCNVEVTPPNIQSRDRYTEIKADQVLKQEGVLSTQTWSVKQGLDYEAEQSNRKTHAENVGDLDSTGLTADDLNPSDKDTSDNGEGE